MNRLLLITFFLLLFGLTLAEAQNTISGKVTDAETGEPIVGVNIYLANTTIGATSRQDGNYVLKTTEKGQFQLIFSFVGYHRKIKNVEIKTGSNLQISEELKPQVVELNQVEVVSSNKEWQNNCYGR